MDLSRFKWPVIILVVAAVIWLTTDQGVSYMHRKFMSGPVGADPKKDELNEAGLTRLGGFLMSTYRFQRAVRVFEDAIRRYPKGKNYYYNYFRLGKCKQELGNPQEAVRIYEELFQKDANSIDSRVATRDQLRLRIDKLKELHELGEIGRPSL